MLYLDVDGVLNALSNVHAFDDAEPHAIAGYQLLLSAEQGRRLAALDADIRWLTTWGRDAYLVGERIGLPSLPVAADPPDAVTSSGPWKYEAVRRQVEDERRPFVWIDDNAISRPARAWAERLDLAHLLIAPDPLRGVGPDDLGRVEGFIAALAQAA